MGTFGKGDKMPFKTNNPSNFTMMALFLPASKIKNETKWEQYVFHCSDSVSQIHINPKKNMKKTSKIFFLMYLSVAYNHESIYKLWQTYTLSDGGGWSNCLTFELYNIFSRNFQDRCQMTKIGPMIFRDRGKRTEFAEYTLWNGIAYISKFKRKRHFMSPNPPISLCFSLTSTLILLIAAFAATLTVLIAAYAVSTCDLNTVSEIHCNDVIQLDYF